MKNWYNLETIGCSQKSFYGKAKMCLHNDEMLLKSYDTIVCKLDAKGHFIRLWDGYSATTMKHINSFRVACFLPKISKKEWEKMEVGVMA